MTGKSGAAAATLQPCEEQALRGHIESVAAGKTNLTDEQLVDLLCSAFPQSYSRTNRKLLAGRVAKITPLPCRRGDAIDEPTPAASNKRQKTTPVTDKRPKIDETRTARRQNKVLDSSNLDVDDYLEESYESDDFSDSVDVDGINREISGDLGVGDELGHGRREMNKDGHNVNGNNRPRPEGLWDLRLKELTVPLHQSKLLRHLGVESIPRILLHGPPGCGKTTFARAIASGAGVPLFEISAAELVSRASGAPQENIRELFCTAWMRAPSIVFIDDIDAMTSKKESLQEIELHIVNQLIACMDEPYKLIKPVNHDADSESSNRSSYVMVIGATNRLDALDPALRRRFDRELLLGDPFGYYRCHILSSLTRNLKVEDGLDLEKLGRCTWGFVARDLVALVKKASILAVNRIMDKRTSEAESYKQPFHDEELENVSITMADFVKAGKWVQPSSEIEPFPTTPKAKWKWDDVGGLEFVKLMFERHIVQHIKFPEVYKDLGAHFRSTFSFGLGCRRKTLITRFLLHGPSGCGKTLIGEALANEAGAKFIHVKGHMLMSLDGGPGELLVQILFSYARTCSPCILFFDELEQIAHGKESSVINQFLKLDFSNLVRELDDAKNGRGVYIIAATNRDDVKKRVCYYFDEVLTIHPPTPVERGAILKALARSKPLDASVDLMALGKDVACENSSGANLYALMKEAASIAIDRPPSPSESCRVPWTIKDEDLKTAMKRIHPFARARCC